MLQQSKQLRQQYEQELEQQLAIDRKAKLRYYESQLHPKPKYFKFIKTPNRSCLLQSIKIPKVEQSYRDFTDIKNSLFQDQISVIESFSHQRLENMALALENRRFQKILKELTQVGKTIYFCKTRIRNFKKNIFRSFILNYNRQVSKEQFQRIADALYAHIQHFLLKQILFQWSLIAKQKKRALQLIFMKQYFLKWRRIQPISPTLIRAFKVWKGHVREKRAKRFYTYLRTKKLFEFWKLWTSLKRVRVRQQILAKHHYNKTLILCVFGLLQQNILLNRGNQSQFSNEFLKSDSQIQTIKLQQ
ncbi:unnamed protein product (macronuclear) [Paramecium tetraurelia]|uniref:Sfi1 spindle body domain-containing protein n=1 Tax=Paramecium tetraurelia TaxID=5888 RepID=A0DUV7_PARTE|nr:uncharacterized protein GSPATT00020486001 [Paramecium tetraurelia]CAK86824.1 unnamed protein product [Paramecium tetraurelia]|eukprot:XP_001454221.1 hypothetical protein (macronuclear) [Paramecium tetraurelia strain d4-2]